MLRKWVSQEHVPAIHVRDLGVTLEKLGLLQALQEGSLTCFSCSSTLSVDQIQCLFILEGRLAVCCDNPACFARAIASPRTPHE